MQAFQILLRQRTFDRRIVTLILGQPREFGSPKPDFEEESDDSYSQDDASSSENAIKNNLYNLQIDSFISAICSCLIYQLDG